MSKEIQDQNSDTQIICSRQIELELILKDIGIENAFDVHMKYEFCLDCDGLNNPDCDFYNSYLLNRRLNK